MKKKTTLELVEQSEKVSFYSISFAADRTTEFELFIREFEDEAILNKDYQRILTALRIILDKGALERFFRPEGKMDDNVQAIPIYGGKLRLYCLRISEQIVILGNGGAKTTNSYQNDPKLFGYVIDLQRFDKILKENIEKGYISIEEKVLNGIEDLTFEI